MLKILSSYLCSLYKERQLHINTDFVVTGWVLCVIPPILKDLKDHSDSDHRKQVNKVIKKLSHVLSLDKMSVTQGMFWADCVTY